MSPRRMERYLLRRLQNYHGQITKCKGGMLCIEAIVMQKNNFFLREQNISVCLYDEAVKQVTQEFKTIRPFFCNAAVVLGSQPTV